MNKIIKKAKLNAKTKRTKASFFLVLENGEGALAGLGELLNRDVSTLSNAASTMRTAVEGDETVRKSLNKIIKKAKLNDETKRTKA